MSDTSANNKRNLDEVSFIRPILIVLLVFVHVLQCSMVAGLHLKAIRIVLAICGSLELATVLCWRHSFLSLGMFGLIRL